MLSLIFVHTDAKYTLYTFVDCKLSFAHNDVIPRSVFSADGRDWFVYELYFRLRWLNAKWIDQI